MKKNVIAILLAIGALASGAASASAAGFTADDSAITGKVQGAIFREPSLRASQLTVSTRGGVVHLTGVVEKALDVDTAAALAGGVPGVAQVKKEFVTVKQ